MNRWVVTNRTMGERLFTGTWIAQRQLCHQKPTQINDDPRKQRSWRSLHILQVVKKFRVFSGSLDVSKSREQFLYIVFVHLVSFRDFLSLLDCLLPVFCVVYLQDLNKPSFRTSWFLRRYSPGWNILAHRKTLHSSSLYRDFVILLNQFPLLLVSCISIGQV